MSSWTISRLPALQTYSKRTILKKKFWFKILLTNLSLVEVDGIDHTLHSCIEVSRIEHNKGGFPSQLEGKLLPAPSRGLAEDLPHLR